MKKTYNILRTCTLQTILFFLLGGLSAVPIFAQDTIQKENQGHKFMLAGNFSYTDYRTIDHDYYYGNKELKGQKLTIKPRFGYFANEKTILGFGLGFTFLEDHPDIQYSSFTEQMEIAIISKKDLSTSLFVRHESGISKKLKYYFDIEAGMDFNLYYKRHYRYSYYYFSGKDSNDFFGNFSTGVTLMINKNFALQTELLNLSYRADYKKGDEKPFSTFDIGYLFSNPNIGLVFYF